MFELSVFVFTAVFVFIALLLLGILLIYLVSKISSKNIKKKNSEMKD